MSYTPKAGAWYWTLRSQVSRCNDGIQAIPAPPIHEENWEQHNRSPTRWIHYTPTSDYPRVCNGWSPAEALPCTNLGSVWGPPAWSGGGKGNHLSSHKCWPLLITQKPSVFRSSRVSSSEGVDCGRRQSHLCWCLITHAQGNQRSEAEEEGPLWRNIESARYGPNLSNCLLLRRQQLLILCCHGGRLDLK